MTQLQVVEDLFHGALEQPAGERTRWLRERCGADSALFNEVESLLPQEEDISPFLPWAASAAATVIADPFRLLAACHLGPYAVTEFVAEGGMGIVYRAHDARTGRDVAIKVLKSARTEHLAREVQAVAALNHPNICTLYDVGENYLVMEFVNGPPLKGPLPLPAALSYAGQIACGLQAMHRAGIIHCDLKPANIRVTPDGVVKVLDFGLAKWKTGMGDTPVNLDGHGVYTAGEQTSAAMGTISYMSPEQALGKPLDPRTDVWALGVVLYELLTGTTPFRGATAAATIDAILHSEPDWISIPSPVRAILRKCLEKDAKCRLTDLSEFERLSRRSLPARQAKRVIALIAVLLAAICLWIFWPGHRQQELPLRVSPFTAYAGDESYPSFSPDGKHVVFTFGDEKTDIWNLYLKDLDASTATQLTNGLSDDVYPVWSPNGNSIAFLRYGRDTGVYLVESDAGVPRRLRAMEACRTRPSWTADGQSLIVAEPLPGSNFDTWGGALILIPVNGGPVKEIVTPPPGVWYRDPAVSRDGRSLAFVSCVAHEDCNLEVAPLNHGWEPISQSKVVAQIGQKFFGLAWTADSKALIYGASTIEDVEESYLWRLDLAGDGKPKRLEAASKGAFSPAVASLGQRLVFARSMSDADIWQWRPGHPAERILASGAIDESPTFSPSGNRIAFVSGRGLKGTVIWTSDAHGSDVRQLTTGGDEYHRSPRWSPDGTKICFEARGKDKRWRIRTVDLSNSAHAIDTIGAGAWNDQWPTWSHTGNWIYFASDRSGRFEIWRIPPAGGMAEQVTNNGGYRALDSSDGSTLYYTKLRGDGPLYVRHLGKPEESVIVKSVSKHTFEVADDGIYFGDNFTPPDYQLRFYSFATQRIRTIGPFCRWLNAGLSVSPDGQTFLFSQWSRVGSDLMIVDNFR